MKGSDILILALGWVLIFEGISPLAAPRAWLRALKKLSHADPRAVRAAASVLVALGLLIVWSCLGPIN